MNISIHPTVFNPDEIDIRDCWFKNLLSTLDVSETPGWPDSLGDALIKWNIKNTVSPIKVLSLFSGAGGLDIGFHDAGFNIVECVEIEDMFAATLLENSTHGSRFEGSKIVCQDINDYEPSNNNIDFIIGGPPCQTFSSAGVRAGGVNGTDDERGNLFKQYARILETIKPLGFLFENVYGIVGAQNGKPWENIQKAFQDAGYKLYWRILDAADYGVPQFRERLFIVGLKEGSYMFPFPSHGPDSQDKRNYYISSCAISNVTSTTLGSNISGRHGHLLNDIPPGLNYSFYTDRLGHPKPIFGWRSKFSDYLYKADPNTPVRTIKAQGGQYTGPFHWENRTFSIEEIKRLQTFPDNYSIVGNRQKIVHQLGNSVPPQLSRILALSILQQVFKEHTPCDMSLMPDSYKLGFRARKSASTSIYAEKAAKALANQTKPTSKNVSSKSEKVFCKLTSDFQLVVVPKVSVAEYILEHSLEEHSLNISIYENSNSQKDIKYELSVSLSNTLGDKPGFKSIVLRSFSNKHKSILGLWKYLEHLIRNHYHKDDLVQLFGYYQCKSDYSIDLKLLDISLSSKSFWKVLNHVCNGNSIGSITHIRDLAYDYDVPEDKLMKELKNLKSLGFEIRNKNTNKQINDGMILIPYSFPSLNERSLHRLTGL
ncbi:MAG: DNA (cytosine-5-)-methyltransferase [Candidatus Brocadiales bacterium]|nr:DNA (cytosine-5-)-methyltransferase [Candidatus Brocadiales bacterium]